MFRTNRTLACIFAFVALAGVNATAQYDPKLIMTALQDRNADLVLLASHRGEILGTYSGAPENSETALYNAAAAGFEMIELDIFTTSDGTVYLQHDKTLKRMLGLDRGASSLSPAATWAQWAEFSAINLCGDRGKTISNSYVCPTAPTTSPYLATSPTLTQAVNFLGGLTLPHFTQTWGGLMQLDVRDQDSLVKAWTALVGNQYTADQVIFKLSPVKLGLSTLADIQTVLGNSTLYTGLSDTAKSAQLASDMQTYMNLMIVYQCEGTESKEQDTGDASWAIHDWEYWMQNHSSFHRLLSPMVGVKASPGKYVSTSTTSDDPLYTDITNGTVSGTTYNVGHALNVTGVYSTYFECNNPSGNQNLPNVPSYTGNYYNGYFSDGGKCVVLQPSTSVAPDGIDHRYDYTFIQGTLNFGMVIADTVGQFATYLNGKSLRNVSHIRREVAAPQSLTISSVTESSATATVSNVNQTTSETPSYTYSLIHNGATVQTSTSTSTSASFTSLTPSTTYTMSVTETIGSLTSPATTTTFTTSAVAAVTGLTASVSAGAVSLSWTEPHSAANPSYAVTATPTSGGSAVSATSISGTTASFSSTALVAATSYTFTVNRTVSTATASTSTTATTGVNPITNLTQTSTGVSVLELSFSAPSNAGSQTVTYNVYCNGTTLTLTFTGSTSFGCNGLNAGTTYSPKITATINSITSSATTGTFTTNTLTTPTVWVSNKSGTKFAFSITTNNTFYSNEFPTEYVTQNGKYLFLASIPSTPTSNYQFGIGSGLSKSTSVPWSAKLIWGDTSQYATVTGTTTTANADPPDQTISKYQWCADENSTCNLPSTSFYAVFGASPYYYFKQGSTSYSCSTGTFGDPISGTKKSCYYILYFSPTSLNVATTEGGSYTIPSTYTNGAAIFFVSSRGKWTQRSWPAGTSLKCKTDVFGDPDPGYSKTCYVYPF